MSKLSKIVDYWAQDKLTSLEDSPRKNREASNPPCPESHPQNPQELPPSKHPRKHRLSQKLEESNSRSPASLQLSLQELNQMWEYLLNPLAQRPPENLRWVNPLEWHLAEQLLSNLLEERERSPLH